MELLIASLIYPIFIMLAFFYVLERVFYIFEILLDFIWGILKDG